LSKTKIKIKIVEIPLKDLFPAEYNPRKLTRQVIDDVKTSIIEFGFADPVVVNKRRWDNDKLVIVGGHKRWIAVKEMRDEGIWKRDTIPCVIRRLSETEEKALNIALNKIQDEFDLKLLAQVVEDIQKDKPELIGKIGFREPELRGLIVDPDVEAMKFSDVANEFLQSHPEQAEEALWLYCEPRSVEEFEAIKKAIGNPSNRMLNMDKLVEACMLLTGYQTKKILKRHKKTKMPRRKK